MGLKIEAGHLWVPAHTSLEIFTVKCQTSSLTLSFEPGGGREKNHKIFEDQNLL